MSVTDLHPKFFPTFSVQRTGKMTPEMHL
uniref:Uncharacterized protein n=1 Tax=Anguilla anguilla TaxID=7936 RepID=A0A0E9TV36_ANGAN